MAENIGGRYRRGGPTDDDDPNLVKRRPSADDNPKDETPPPGAKPAGAPGTPPDDETDPGKLIYDYSDLMKQEPELIRIKREEAKSAAEKKDKKRRTINLENSKDKTRDNTRDGADKLFRNAIVGTVDTIFNFLGFGGDETKEPMKDKEK